MPEMNEITEIPEKMQLYFRRKKIFESYPINPRIYLGECLSESAPLSREEWERAIGKTSLKKYEKN